MRICPLLLAPLFPVPHHAWQRSEHSPLDHLLKELPLSSRTVLLARGAFNVLFGLGSWVWLLTHDGQRLARGGTYALIDGLFGALLAFTLYRSSDARWLSVLAVCDGLIRLLIGSLMLANPGMERMILGGAVFMTGIILACSALGLGGMAYALAGRRPALGRLASRSTPQLVPYQWLTISGVNMPEAHKGGTAGPQGHDPSALRKPSCRTWT